MWRFKGLTSSPPLIKEEQTLDMKILVQHMYIFYAFKGFGKCRYKIAMCTYIQCADSRKEDVPHNGWQRWPWRSWRSLIWLHTSVVRGRVGQVKGQGGSLSPILGDCFVWTLNKHHFHPHNWGRHFQAPAKTCCICQPSKVYGGGIKVISSGGSKRSQNKQQTPMLKVSPAVK